MLVIWSIFTVFFENVPNLEVHNTEVFDAS